MAVKHLERDLDHLERDLEAQVRTMAHSPATSTRAAPKHAALDFYR